MPADSSTPSTPGKGGGSPDQHLILPSCGHGLEGLELGGPTSHGVRAHTQPSGSLEHGQTPNDGLAAMRRLPGETEIFINRVGNEL